MFKATLFTAVKIRNQSRCRCLSTDECVGFQILDKKLRCLFNISEWTWPTGSPSICQFCYKAWLLHPALGLGFPSPRRSSIHNPDILHSVSLSSLSSLSPLLSPLLLCCSPKSCPQINLPFDSQFSLNWLNFVSSRENLLEWIEKVWYIDIVGVYSAVNKTVIMTFSGK